LIFWAILAVLARIVAVAVVVMGAASLLAFALLPYLPPAAARATIGCYSSYGFFPFIACQGFTGARALDLILNLPVMFLGLLTVPFWFFRQAFNAALLGISTVAWIILGLTIFGVWLLARDLWRLLRRRAQT
jgi:hypothetical protein